MLARPLARPIARPIASTLYKGGGVDPGADSNITALNLWAGGLPGGWRDPSDWTTTFQTTDTSTPAVAAGDPVQRVNDKSPNGRNWLAAGTNNRGALFSSGGVRGIKLDGVDDGYADSGGLLGTAMSVFYAIDRVTDASWVLGDGPQQTNVIWSLAAASGTSSFLNVGTPTIRVNGTVIGSTRQNLLDACPANTPVVIHYAGLPLSNISIVNFSKYSGFFFGGRIICEITCVDQPDANRITIQNYLAAKAGFAL